MGWAHVTATIIFGYLCGSIPFSFLVARMHGVDLRQVGSGNTGASNVWRTIGFPNFVAALALDIVKGFVPTAIAYYLLHFAPLPTILVGLAAVIGHVYPIFLGFRGGKAVATTSGVVLAIQPLLWLVGAITWTTIYKLSGYASVASLGTLIIGAVVSAVMALSGMLTTTFALFIWISMAVVVYLHRSNIERLMRGTENRIGPRTK